MTIEKEEKPKKLFTVKFDIYDDGQVDPDLIEYVQGPVGRPKQWRLDPQDFVRSVKAQLSETPHILYGYILAQMGLENSDIKKLQIPEHKLGEAVVVDSDEDSDFDFDED